MSRHLRNSLTACLTASALLVVSACSGGDEESGPSAPTDRTTASTSVTAGAPSTSTTPTTTSELPGVRSVGTFRGAPEVLLEPGIPDAGRQRQIEALVELPPAKGFWVNVDGIDSHLWVTNLSQLTYVPGQVALLVKAMEVGRADSTLVIRPEVHRYGSGETYWEYDEPIVTSKQPLSRWAGPWGTRVATMASSAPQEWQAESADFTLRSGRDAEVALECEATPVTGLAQGLRWMSRTKADVRRLEFSGRPYANPRRCSATYLDVTLPPRASLDTVWRQARSYPGKKLDVDLYWPGAEVSIDWPAKPVKQVEVARMLVDRGYRVGYGAAPDLTIKARDLEALRAVPGLLAPYHRVIPKGELYEVRMPGLSIMGHEDTQSEAIAVMSRLQGCGIGVEYRDDVTDHQQLWLRDSERKPGEEARCALRRLAQGDWVGDQVTKVSITWVGRGNDNSGEMILRRDGTTTVVKKGSYGDVRPAQSRRLVRAWKRVAD